MRPPKLSLALILIGILLILGSLVWNPLVPDWEVAKVVDDQLEALDQHGNREDNPGGVASPNDDGPAPTLTTEEQERGTEESRRIRRENAEYVERVRVIRERIPRFLRVIGVVCAATGSVLYPFLVLRRKREAAASVLE